jgi:murein DD-endopeptidase MepM/ murein hydrolase activator NlpD
MQFRWLFLLFATVIFAKGDLSYFVSSNELANAKTIFLEFDPNQETKCEYVAFLGKRYPLFKKPHSDICYTFLTTSYYQKPRSAKAMVVYKQNNLKGYIPLYIDIVDGHYKSEKLRVNPKKAKFSKSARVRIARELKEAKKFYNTYTKTLYINSPFILPLHSKITSAFGNKRIFNSMLKSYHSGTDFRAKKGTPIIASNSGKVVLVKNRFFAGNSVIIDHGHGIYSGYYHLSRFAVKKGDFVQKGQVVGYSGATGRVTGPHLHFTFHVGGNCVDPLDFVKLANEYLF